MTYEHKTAGFELKREPDHDGIFEGYASVFGIVDNGLDVVEQGAFEKSLTDRKAPVRMLWQHNAADVIGVWDEIREDHKGLYVKGRVLKDVAKGSEALALMRAGAINSMSIGYQTVKAASEGAGSVRKLLELKLWEISLVTFPMLPDAIVTDVKSIGTEREFERFLRDAGMSRKEAAAVSLHGFKGLNSQRDAVNAVDSASAKALLKQITKLTEKING